MIQKRTIGALAGLVLTGVFGQASVIYTFSGTGNGSGPDEPVAFELTVPTFITPIVGFTCAQLDSSTDCQSNAPLASIFFLNGDPFTGSPAMVEFNATNGTNYYFDFYFGAFATPGTYATSEGNQDPGTLTVAFASVPESQTLSLVATGLLGGFWVAHIRRRKRKCRA